LLEVRLAMRGQNFHGRDPFPALDIQAVEQRVGDVIDADPPACTYLVAALFV
jgi:hypothetical protein